VTWVTICGRQQSFFIVEPTNIARNISAASGKDIVETHKSVFNTTKETDAMSSKSNRINIPEARNAMNRFKMESASEVGVNLKDGYNGDLTSRQAGSVGGQMVKKIVPAGLNISLIFVRNHRNVEGHQQVIKYLVDIAI
jgi:hypothetical protein